jgi:hypothetical protein
MVLVSERITFYGMENGMLAAKRYEVGRDSLFSDIVKQVNAFNVTMWGENFMVS